MHHQEAFANLDFVVGRGLGNAAGLAFVGEDDGGVEADGEFAHQHIAFLDLLAVGILFVKPVVQAVVGFLETFFVGAVAGNHHCCGSHEESGHFDTFFHGIFNVH